MNPMKEALKRKMVAPQAAPVSDMDERDAEGKLKGSDLAPPLQEGDMEDTEVGEGRMQVAPGMSVDKPELEIEHLGPEQMAILQALASGGAQGREANGLDERAAMGAKAKLASLKGPGKY